MFNGLRLTFRHKQSYERRFFDRFRFRAAQTLKVNISPHSACLPIPKKRLCNQLFFCGLQGTPLPANRFQVVADFRMSCNFISEVWYINASTAFRLSPLSYISALMIDQKGKTQSIEDLSTSRNVDIDTLAAELGIDERKLMRKIDWHVLPVLCGFYLLQAIDKVEYINPLTT